MTKIERKKIELSIVKISIWDCHAIGAWSLQDISKMEMVYADLCFANAVLKRTWELVVFTKAHPLSVKCSFESGMKR